MSEVSPRREAPDLWSFAWGSPQVDPEQLALGIEAELRRDDQDFRTRLLIRDGAKALELYWGRDRWEGWVSERRLRTRIDAIRGEDLGRPGFDFSGERMIPSTDRETILRYLRELGVGVSAPCRIQIGGSIPLMLSGLISRTTNDIDVVDEVPDSIRSERSLLTQLQSNYGLLLTHFASRYLPEGWSSRTRSLGSFGRIQVELVDTCDIFLSKLYSGRTRDRNDLRALTSHIDRSSIIDRLLKTTGKFRSEDALRGHAETNWYILYGEPLPAPPSPPIEEVDRTP